MWKRAFISEMGKFCRQEKPLQQPCFWPCLLWIILVYFSESTSTRARDRREWSSESSRYRGSRHHEERRRSSSSGSKHKKSRKRSRSRDKSDSKRDKRSRERDESYAHKDDTRQKLRHREHSRSRRNSLSGVRSRSRERFKKRSGRHDELALNGRGQEWSVENGVTPIRCQKLS